MKKILLTIICLVIIISTNAQSFSLQDTNGVAISAGSTVSFTGEPTDDIITARIDIKNISGVAKDVKVKKFHANVLPNTMNYFCWGLCYGPDTYDSPYAQMIEPGAVSDQFYGDYSPLGVAGLSTVMYTFYDADNRDDSVSVYVEFKAVFPPVQSFSLQDTNGVAINAGSTIVVTGDPSDNIITARIDIMNNSEVTKDVIVKKVHTAVLPNTMNYFCWGVCYGPDTFESPFSQPIGAGAVSDQFYGDYSPLTVIGKSTIMYTFFDAANPDDSVAIYVDFNASPSAIGEDLAGVKFSEAYPNPASSKVSVDFTLPAGVNKASVKISSMLGAQVSDISLEEVNGTIRIDVSSLQNGIYFYSLMADDQMVITRKFVVKH